MRVKERIGRFLIRLSTICVVAGVLLALPDLETDSILRYKNAAVAFAFIIALGKILYDTFFYDRFYP